MSYAKPYAGVKVLDLSQGIAGPYASALLAQQGANVIKVEPQRGDWMRPKGKDGPFGDMTPSFVIANLGKRSLVVDLKTTQGVAVVRQLAAEADIFMEGFRPGVIERLGLGYKVVADLNPRVIYLSVSGFGQEGPLRERPATDGVLQAFSGFMSVNRGPDNMPHRAGVPIIDLATSLYNLQAMQAALWARQSAGEGCYIDNSLLRGAASFYNMSLASEHLLGPERPLGIYPSGIFATTDGFINVICLHDHNFPVLCDILGLAEFRDHPDYKTVVQREGRRGTLEPAIREAIARQSSDAWCERLTAAGRHHAAGQYGRRRPLRSRQPAARPAPRRAHGGRPPRARLRRGADRRPDRPRHRRRAAWRRPGGVIHREISHEQQVRALPGHSVHHGH